MWSSIDHRQDGEIEVNRRVSWRWLDARAQRLPIILLSSLSVLISTGMSGQSVALQTIHLPTPIGEHRIGVRETLLFDRDRLDTLAGRAGSPRPILVRVWYPADSSASPARKYMPGAVAEAWRSTLPVPAGFEAAIHTNAVPDAPVSSARQRWPVLLFSHGRSFPVENYQLLLEQLASHGWVTVAISHPYEETATQLPDGRVLPFAGPRWASDSLRGGVLQGVVDNLVRDAALVLDWVHSASGSAGDPFRGRLALDRGVGYLGHSLGGSAAVWAMQRDPRVVAAVSWEGQVYQQIDRPLRVRGPLLYIIAGANRQELVGTQFRPIGRGAPVYELVLGGAVHASVGDLLFLYRHYAPTDWLRRHWREMDPKRANQISGDYIHEFFGHYLLEREFDLLWPDSIEEMGKPGRSNYAEVELRIYGP